MCHQFIVPHTRHSRHQYPLTRIGRIVHRIRFAYRSGLHDGTGVRQAGNDTHQYGNFIFFGKIERFAYHIVRLLLGGRLENRHHRKFAVKTGILFVLRRVHRGIVGGNHDQSAVRTGHCRIDKCIGSDIHTYMFHTYHRPFTHIGHSERSFHRCLFITRPLAMDTAFSRQRIGLYKFGNLGRRSAGIGINSGKAGMNRT